VIVSYGGDTAQDPMVPAAQLAAALAATLNAMLDRLDAGVTARRRLVADASHQALTNMIENAIKFTGPGGKVTVSSWQGGREVGVTVADNGPGIPSEARAHVFDRFFRADRSRSRESGGSGLGLAICYEIAAAHRGRIWVESEEGRGSAFSIALPAGNGADQRPGR
jgi:signal transduction histidine kinase